MSGDVICPQCGMLFQPCHLIPLHTESGATCAGVGQKPRCAEADRRPLWNGERNPHLPSANNDPAASLGTET